MAEFEWPDGWAVYEHFCDDGGRACWVWVGEGEDHDHALAIARGEHTAFPEMELVLVSAATLHVDTIADAPASIEPDEMEQLARELFPPAVQEGAGEGARDAR